MAARRPRTSPDAPRRTVALLVTALFAVLLMLPVADAGSVTYPDRESSYPDAIVNVTQDPWRPAWGEDVTVTVRLADDTPTPDITSLLFCRVEPGYACGLPVMMEATDDAARTWVGTIEWDERFMRPGLRHMGYNITLHDQDDGTRLSAPKGNYMLPDTYPEEADGVYFFYAVAPEQAGLSAPGVAPLVVLFVLLALVHRSTGTHGRRRRR